MKFRFMSGKTDGYLFSGSSRTIAEKRQVITICLWWHWKGLGLCRGKFFSGSWGDLALRNGLC